jgi:hypothetical protein
MMERAETKRVVGAVGTVGNEKTGLNRLSCLNGKGHYSLDDGVRVSLSRHQAGCKGGLIPGGSRVWLPFSCFLFVTLKRFELLKPFKPSSLDDR